jgi:glutamate formiminotransferase/formiminotetrahydrofolate cyclodeaminase
MHPIIECVPNFSEGRDPELIRKITDEIGSVEGVRLLNVDPGKATNRTVVTFVGRPEAVVEAAFRSIRKAGELIDMSKHRGEHPRMGATDVCPLIPVSGISMEETAAWARRLGERVGNELNIPVYLYEAAQSNRERSSLSVIRSGEYEGFFEKINQPGWEPDFGPVRWDARRGGTVIGARDFLVAYNVNLNTVSVRRANAIAFDVREAGRVRKAGNKVVLDERGQPVNVPGTLRCVKAIGWYIEEYGIAQISMNLTNLGVTPLHVAFDEVCRKAEARGIRVTGSELVGLIPLRALTEAGKYFLRKQHRSAGLSEKELLRLAIRTMGLDELAPFKPEERIIEYLLAEPSASRLAHSSLSAFADETASERPAPGGGSVAAYLGALGAALGSMVANLSAQKKGWDDRWESFSQWAERGQRAKEDLLNLVDEDTIAFDRVMVAFSLPKGTPEEQDGRQQAIQEATRQAIAVPLQVMKFAYGTLDLIQAMAKEGNPSSASDAGVGAICVRGAVFGASLNVRINAAALEDRKYARLVLDEAAAIEAMTARLEEEILDLVKQQMELA